MTEVVAALIWQGDKFMICQRPTFKLMGFFEKNVGGMKYQTLDINTHEKLYWLFASDHPV